MRKERFLQSDHSDEVIVIPAIKDQREVERVTLRVCAYCRVSTDLEEQAPSLALQTEHYAEHIKKNPGWAFAGIYADEGISGTSVRRRKQFKQMIEDCHDGKIDLIITKSISRFARNTIDCISYIRDLRQLVPPVGVLFELEGLNTLDQRSETYLTFLSAMAQGESEEKSLSIKWAIRKRFRRGMPLCPTWALLGYTTDDDGNMVIVPEEADLVKSIYQMYIDGFSSVQIADMLTAQGRKTALGNTMWYSGSVLNILRNEKYCGDVLMQKTVTLDPLSHKVVKNRGHETQYRLNRHHEAIIGKNEWELVQSIIDGGRRKSRRVGKMLHPFKIYHTGALKGFILIDEHWGNAPPLEEMLKRTSRIMHPQQTKEGK